MLTLGEAQEIFIDAMPDLKILQVTYTMATDAEPTYVEYWQCDEPVMDMHWFEEPGHPVMIEIENSTDVLQYDIVDPEDVESVVVRLTQK